MERMFVMKDGYIVTEDEIRRAYMICYGVRTDLTKEIDDYLPLCHGIKIEKEIDQTVSIEDQIKSFLEAGMKVRAVSLYYHYTKATNKDITLRDALHKIEEIKAKLEENKGGV